MAGWSQAVSACCEWRDEWSLSESRGMRCEAGPVMMTWWSSCLSKEVTKLRIKETEETYSSSDDSKPPLSAAMLSRLPLLMLTPSLCDVVLAGRGAAPLREWCALCLLWLSTVDEE